MTFIIDPLNKRRIVLHSSDGLNILKKYIKTFQLGGSDSSDSSDSSDLENPFLTKKQQDEIHTNIENIPTDSDESIENQFLYKPKPIPDSVKLYYENVSNLFMDLLRNKIKLPHYEHGKEFEIENIEQFREYFTNMNKLLDEGEYIVAASPYWYLSYDLCHPSSYYRIKSSRQNMIENPKFVVNPDKESYKIPTIPPDKYAIDQWNQNTRKIHSYISNLEDPPIKLAFGGTFVTNKLNIISSGDEKRSQKTVLKMIHKKFNINLTLNEIILLNRLISIFDGIYLPYFEGPRLVPGYNPRRRNNVTQNYGLFLNYEAGADNLLDVIPLLQTDEITTNNYTHRNMASILMLPFIKFVESLREKTLKPTTIGQDYIRKISNYLFAQMGAPAIIDSNQKWNNWQEWNFEDVPYKIGSDIGIMIDNYDEIHQLFTNLETLINKGEYIIAINGEFVDFTPNMFTFVRNSELREGDTHSLRYWKWTNINNYNYILKPGFFIITNKFNVVIVSEDGSIETQENNIELNEYAIILISSVLGYWKAHGGPYFKPKYKRVTHNKRELLNELDKAPHRKYTWVLPIKGYKPEWSWAGAKAKQYNRLHHLLNSDEPVLEEHKNPVMTNSFEKEYIFNFIDLVKNCLTENQDVRTNPFKKIT